VRKAILILIFSLLLNSFSIVNSNALNTTNSICKKMLKNISKLDEKQKSAFSSYSQKYKIARESKSIEDNMSQTRALLELFENDRTIFLLALENKKCFSKTEIENLEIALKNTTDDAETVRNWIYVKIGIPGKNFYSSYIPFAKDITTPRVLSSCPKLGQKFKTLTCKKKNGELIWIDSANPIGKYESWWPTDFIDGYVNWREAADRLYEFLEQLSLASSTDGPTSVQFQKDRAYPGLFDFNSEPKLSACQKFIDLQNNAGKLDVKYTADFSSLISDPEWKIESSPNGELLTNQKFKGQIFSVLLKVDITQGAFVNNGTYSIKHIAIINGEVYRFSAC
jgi:hypothetical protein